MHTVDLIVFIIYILLMLGVGLFFHFRNKSMEDYYVGGRKMGSWHVGLSVVATDVGGGFSIGLGGLGFLIGLAGSWMLFTGLIGAWLSAVLLIPRIKKIPGNERFYTFPQLFNHYYDHRVALIAGIISAIGYIGFTSSQLLAGAKLASATFQELNLNHAILIMGAVAVVYTVMGGLKAVIYTDSIQWAILITGLIFVGIPMSYVALGGWDEISDFLPDRFLSLTNVRWQDLVNWAVTIIPIWFVGMTLYQRIYATRSIKEAKRAWFIAGLFEWPVMAFMGVILGLFARIALDKGLLVETGFEDMANFDPEMGLPLLLRNVLPYGAMGLILAAYFSAILSTADSCLMAASGNILTDIIEKFTSFKSGHKTALRISKVLTFAVGVLAIIIALKMRVVLDLMLYSYAFMVSGLLMPVIGALFMKRTDVVAALSSMIAGGTLTLVLIIGEWDMPLGLDPNIFGISASVVVFLGLNHYRKSKIIQS